VALPRGCLGVPPKQHRVEKPDLMGRRQFVLTAPMADAPPRGAALKAADTLTDTTG